MATFLLNISFKFIISTYNYTCHLWNLSSHLPKSAHHFIDFIWNCDTASSVIHSGNLGIILMFHIQSIILSCQFKLLCISRFSLITVVYSLLNFPFLSIWIIVTVLNWFTRSKLAYKIPIFHIVASIIFLIWKYDCLYHLLKIFQWIFMSIQKVQIHCCVLNSF